MATMETMKKGALSAALSMPRIDEWIATRTLPEGRTTSSELWRDWAAYVDALGHGKWALGWRARSLHAALEARGYAFHKSGERWVLGISLRPAGEVAPIAPERVSQDVL